MSKNYLSKNDELRKGDFLMSNNGKWKAIFQDDGNFVIYDKCENPKWDSGTCGSDAFRLCMQSDCNLVMYTQSDTSSWCTNTDQLECNMVRLQLTNDGVLEVYGEAQKVWSSVDPPILKK